MKLVPLVLLLAACGPKTAPVAATEVAAPVEVATEVTGTIEERLERAVARLEAGDVGAAAGELEAITRDDPRNAVAFQNLGVARVRLGDLAGAKTALDTATKLQPDSAVGWLYLGSVHERMGQLSAAVDAYRAGTTYAPDDVACRVALANGLRRLGRPTEAIEASKQALRVNTQSLEAYDALGLAHLDLGQLDLARFVFEKAVGGVSGGTTNASLLCNLGWTFYRQGDVPTAEARLREAIALDPNLVRARVYLARILYENRDYNGMVSELEVARTLDPKNADVLVNLGIAYRGLGRVPEAAAAWEGALTLDPTSPEPWFNLGILSGDNKKEYDLALSQLEKYVAAGGSEVARAQAYIAAFQKEKDRAEKKRQKDAETEKRKAEVEERKRLLEQAPPPEAPAPPPAPTEAPPAPTEAPPVAPAPPEAPAPADPAPADPPAPEAPPAEDNPSPWGAP
jgi:tetratricopeptide (TPR) repeat protein